MIKLIIHFTLAIISLSSSATAIFNETLAHQWTFLHQDFCHCTSNFSVVQERKILKNDSDNSRWCWNPHQAEIAVYENMRSNWPQDIRKCRIRLVVRFLFFLASFKNFGFSTKKNSVLGAVSYGAQEAIWSWVPPKFLKKILVLGSVCYGSQEGLCLWGVSKFFERCFLK